MQSDQSDDNISEVGHNIPEDQEDDEVSVHS